METIGINCSCGNEHAFILSQRLAECTQCQTIHSIDNVKSYTSYDITPLHVLEQRAKVAGKHEQARIAKAGKKAIRNKHGRKT